MHLSRNKQNGLALITVLFIFALVAMLAISIQTRQEFAIMQTESSLENSKAFILAMSIEDIAKAGLTYDGKRDSDTNEAWDTASELWNQALPVNIEGNLVSIVIRDLQGLFNLNSLHPSNPNSKEAQARFSRLLTEVGLDSTVSNNLSEWFTPNNSANYEYQSLVPAYSASEIEMSHPSELMLVKGMDPDSYKLIEPFITALPSSIPLNINTSLPEVISSWDPKLSLDVSKSLINKTRSGQCDPLKRSNYVFKDVDSLFSDEILKDLTDTSKNKNNPWDKGDFDVKTKYFSVFSTIKMPNREITLESIIKRDYGTGKGDGFIGTVYRDFSRTAEDVSNLAKTMNCTGV